ncbi:hypothetical protein N7453_007854 [Penicillium expansum]|nr:hypothetical protein N7453_007854 [Penicillium expansum]
MPRHPPERSSITQIVNGDRMNRYTKSEKNIREDMYSAVGTACRPFSLVVDFYRATALLFSTPNKCQDISLRCSARPSRASFLSF